MEDSEPVMTDFDFFLQDLDMMDLPDWATSHEEPVG